MEHLKANYHSHTWRCGHAWGTEREYVEAAIASNLTVWGFSDHTPIPGLSAERSAGMRMTMEQLPGYVDTVQSLRREFGDKIELHVGLEAEYDPAWFTKLVKGARETDVEYLILGQHFTTDGIYSGVQTDDPERLRDYCRLVKEGMETGLFSLVAHPDLLRFTGDAEIYEEESRSLCRRALELNVPLELNLLGLGTNRHYPNHAFWRIVSEVGNDVVLSLDAHLTEQIGNRKVEADAFALARELGLKVTDRIDLTRLRCK